MPRIVELRWHCAECDARDILGRHKRCPSCGSPRERGEMRMDGLGDGDYGEDGRHRGATVSDPELLDLAQAGFDWFCTRCDSGNRGDGDHCSSCGAAREGEAREARPAELAPLIGEDSDALDLDEEAMVAAWRAGGCVASTLAFATTGVGAAFGGAILCGLGALLCWGNVSHELEGQVSATRWTHTTIREAWTPTRTERFRDEITEHAPRDPVAGSGEVPGLIFVPGTCHEKHHHYEKYVCGTHQACEKVYRTETESYSCSTTETYDCGETCRDMGNGFATCTPDTCTRSVPDTCTRSVEVYDHDRCWDVNDYCDRSITAVACTYDTHAWRESERAVATGTGHDLSWRELPTGPLDRTRHEADYCVELRYTWKKQDVRREVQDLDERAYLSWSEGDRVQVRRKNVGNFEEIRRDGRPVRVR